MSDPRAALNWWSRRDFLKSAGAGGLAATLALHQVAVQLQPVQLSHDDNARRA